MVPALGVSLPPPRSSDVLSVATSRNPVQPPPSPEAKRQTSRAESKSRRIGLAVVSVNALLRDQSPSTHLPKWAQAHARLARLDWEVEQWPFHARRGDDELAVDERVANVRSDTQEVLGVVGPGYTLFQNAQAFEFFDSVVGDRLAIFETAGALKRGRHIWMMARLPQTLRAAGNDEIHPYVLLANSHDGSRALRMVPTTIRVVCANTLHLVLGRNRGVKSLRITHNATLPRRVEEARRKLGIIGRRVEEFGQEVKGWRTANCPRMNSRTTSPAC